MAEEDYVKMLRESLENKVCILEQIQEKNQKQTFILKNPVATPDELDNNLEQKSQLIDQLVQLDNGFEQLYSRVSEMLDKNKAYYKNEIVLMKELIVKITDFSAAIQKQEQMNKILAVDKFSNVRDQVQKVRKSQKAVNSYYKNMMKVNYVDPQFMDSKK